MSKKFWEQKRPLVISEAELKRQELARTLALADAREHPITRAFLEYADEHARNEHETALQPNLTNEVRQFNAGRSAAAYDFTLALREILKQAEAQARKLKQEN